jgi:AcrR family transcriptional regulator
MSTGGEGAVSIRAIADAVGVSPPAIYLHFSDKDELLFAVCARHFAALDQRFLSATDGVDDPVERLRLLARAYVQFGLDEPEPYRVLFMGKPEGVPEHIDIQVMRSTPPFSRLVDAVEDAMAAGVIDRDEPLLVATGLWAAVHGITSLAISMKKVPVALDDLVAHVCATHLRGLTAPAAPTVAARRGSRAPVARQRSRHDGAGPGSRA